MWLGVCIVIFSWLPENYCNSLPEVFRALSILETRVEELVEVWEEDKGFSCPHLILCLVGSDTFSTGDWFK